MIKVVKDNTVQRDDLYKSGTIHTGQGEPPSSRSRPTPKSKQKPGKPISNGKLLRPGGPGGGPSKLASRPAQSRPVPQQSPRTQPAATQPRPVPRPVHELNGVSHVRMESSSSISRAPPPPPPPAAPAMPKKEPKKDIYRVLYDFQGQSANEMRILQKDELLEILQKSDNGRSPYGLVHSYHTTMSTMLMPHRLVACQSRRRRQTRLGSLRLPRRRSHTSRSTASTSASPSSNAAATTRSPSTREWCRPPRYEGQTGTSATTS